MEALDHFDCPDADDSSKKVCLWPRYHNDLAAMMADKKYMATMKNVNMGTIRQTRLQAVSGKMQLANGITLVKERLSTLTWRLQNDLNGL